MPFNGVILAAGSAGGVKMLLNDSQAVVSTSSSAASRRWSYVDVDNELGVTTIDRRQRFSHARYSNSSTLPRSVY